MTHTLRRNAFATSALSIMLAAPVAASAQDSCIEILGTVESNTDSSVAAAEGMEGPALIIAMRSADEAGSDANCIRSLDQLQAAFDENTAAAGDDVAVEPSTDAAEASPAGGADQATADTATEPQAGEDVALEDDASIASEDEAAARDTEDEMAAVVTEEPDTGGEVAADDAVVPDDEGEAMTNPESETDGGEPMVADAEGLEAPDQRLGNASEMLAGITAGEVEGMDVLSPEGEDIGTVEFLVVDTDGDINAVISLDDGVLGLGDSERVVEIGQFDYSTEEESLVLVQLTEEWLETLPEYDSDTPGYVEIDGEARVFTEQPETSG